MTQCLLQNHSPSRAQAVCLRERCRCAWGLGLMGIHDLRRALVIKISKVLQYVVTILCHFLPKYGRHHDNMYLIRLLSVRLINADSRRESSTGTGAPEGWHSNETHTDGCTDIRAHFLEEFNLEQRECFVSPVASLSEAHPYPGSLFLKFMGQFYSTAIPA